MWVFKLMFAGVLKELITFGVMTLLIAGLLIAAWLVPLPQWKRRFLSAAAAVAITMFAYGTGVQHEYDRNRAREKVVQQQTSLARETAEKYVQSNPDPVAPKRGLRLRKSADPYNRDGQ